jgi:hypothetical protein
MSSGGKLSPQGLDRVHSPAAGVEAAAPCLADCTRIAAIARSGHEPDQSFRENRSGQLGGKIWLAYSVGSRSKKRDMSGIAMEKMSQKSGAIATDRQVSNRHAGASVGAAAD